MQQSKISRLNPCCLCFAFPCSQSVQRSVAHQHSVERSGISHASYFCMHVQCDGASRVCQSQTPTPTNSIRACCLLVIGKCHIASSYHFSPWIRSRYLGCHFLYLCCRKPSPVIWVKRIKESTRPSKPRRFPYH